MHRIATLIAITLLTAGHAQASSDDAWAILAAEVEESCLDATKDVFSDAKAVVDPFGSESFGLAVVSGTTSGGTSASIICVFDKQSKVVEIGGELEGIAGPAGAVPAD